MADQAEQFTITNRTGLSWDDVIVVTHDPGKTPPHQLKRELAKIQREFKKTFPSNKVIVIPTGTTVHLLK